RGCSVANRCLGWLMLALAGVLGEKRRRGRWLQCTLGIPYGFRAHHGPNTSFVPVGTNFVTVGE
ncbi:MAG: hypothetical protein LH609_07865, partial [Rudanella sp.]|nr:hypothetical protein [Rudanella sp.]